MAFGLTEAEIRKLDLRFYRARLEAAHNVLERRGGLL